MSNPIFTPILSSGGAWVNVDVKGNVLGKTNSGGPFIDVIGPQLDIRPGSAVRKASKKALDTAKDAGNAALDQGKKAIDAVLKTNPTTAPFAIAADVAGINPLGSGKSWLEQLQDWISETGIFQRLALAILAFVFIAVALSMLGRGVIPGNLASIVKGK